MLRKRHRPGIKPAVDHFRYAMHLTAAIRTGVRYLIDIRPVQFCICCLLLSAFFCQLLAAANALLMSARAFPDRKRRSPVTITGQSPVLDIFQPVSKASFSNRCRNPVHRIIIADQIFFDFGHLYKPGLSCIINKRCVTSPAVRIFMLKLRRVKQQSCRIQIF